LRASPLAAILSRFYSQVQQQLKVEAGAEFRAAMEAATPFRSKIMLGDRPIQVTLQRVWGALTLWEKL